MNPVSVKKVSLIEVKVDFDDAISQKDLEAAQRIFNRIKPQLSEHRASLQYFRLKINILRSQLFTAKYEQDDQRMKKLHLQS